MRLQHTIITNFKGELPTLDEQFTARYKTMEKNIKIHETAFVTSSFRASNPLVSKDTFAHLWANEKTDEHAQQYTQEVSAYEPLAHCLRNRYFYETITSLYQQNKIALVINFGAGFSMYPFLLNEQLAHIEIDQTDVIAYKQERIAAWVEEGKLPYRKIDYICANFNESDNASLLEKIKLLKAERPSLILIEGVLFFINSEDTDRLFQLFGSIQNKGEYVGSVSFKKELEHTLGFKRMTAFIEKNLEANQKFEYQTIDDHFYTHNAKYSLVEHLDHHLLQKKYGTAMKFNKDLLLNEQMYLLKKK